MKKGLVKHFIWFVILVVIMGIALVGCGGGGGSGGNSGSSSPQPSAPVIVSFRADPGYLLSGTTASSVLTWDVTDADRLSITPDIGAVTGATGSVEVQPLTTTTYTLRTENAQGSTDATVTIAVGSATPAGSEAYGDVPAGLPPRLAVGLMEEPDATWMRDSGVPWDMRYHYFVYGWLDNWGYDPPGSLPGRWGLAWMQQCDAQGFIPVVQYYCMNGYSNYDESKFYVTTQNPATMALYFNDFKVLMQRCKDFDKPVLVLMEGDGFAYMEIQSNDDPNAYSAVAASGLSELSSLLNTAAGWGLAFLQLRKAVGANKVILGMHISAWATGKDISYYQTSDALQPEVDKAYDFLEHLGLASNGTGATYDLLVGDPLDRDSGYYEIAQGLGQQRWWDASDTAGINTKSFNRYAEWLRLWNLKTKKRWVLWQIPLGNSNNLNIYNNGNPREGYKDNRPEYFFLNGDTHLRKFADVGILALLFGPGADGQSYYTNDYYTDGELFMQTHAGDILNAGGLPIVTIGK